jgi:CheY-like chemotaxis protein
MPELDGFEVLRRIKEKASKRGKAPWNNPRPLQGA